MNAPDVKPQPKSHRITFWFGWVLTLLIAFAFGMSGAMKLMGGEQLEEGMAQFGLPESMVVPLAIVELSCLAIYLFPPTAVLGAILLTGYLDGAICTHWRVGDQFVIPIAIGICVWLALALRERRLWSLIPLRMKPRQA